MTVQGLKGYLQSDLIHHSYRNLDDVLDKLNRYSSAGAQEMLRQGRPVHGLTLALLHGFWAFVRTYLIRAGFLDGAAGLMLAIYNAECTYYKYVKHSALAQRPPH